MDDDRRFYERPNFWPFLFGVILTFAFLVAFWSELILLWRLLITFFQLIITGTSDPLPQDTPKALIVLAVNLIVFLICYFIILRWVSFFVLPAHTSGERQQVYERLIEYVFKLHGPAVFVKNGQIVSRKEEGETHRTKKDWFASLALVDLSSAIVIESRELPRLTKILNKTPTSGGGVRSPIRALGPGIGFLRPGERILGCVDLRKQSRRKSKVRGFTSDGIELETDVNVTFTLGQAPDVITVIDIKNPYSDENYFGLWGMTIDRGTMKIATISDNIDLEDKREIYASVQSRSPARTHEMAYEKPRKTNAQYFLDHERVIAAVISRPRNSRDGTIEEWTALPVQVGVSILLDELSRISYDQLYSLDRPERECYLYDNFKPEFKQKIINLGVLSYQFVQRKDGNIPQVGDLFIADEYMIWDVQELHSSKPLRDRGIKVLKASFSDFKPIDNTIPEQRFDNWRSKWQIKAEQTNAKYDFEIMRKMNHARAQAQHEIIYNLSQIFKLPGYSQDAMAIRIFQALESAAANPATTKLLPRDTLEMLKNFQRIFLQSDKDGQRADQGLGSGDEVRSTDRDN
jgi:hypothetical protein